MEVWGNTYKTITNSIFTQQKRAIRITNRANYHKPTNKSFIHSHALKHRELVDFKIALIMYKVKNKMVPGSIQRLFQPRENQNKLRGMCMFTKRRVDQIQNKDAYQSLELMCGIVLKMK